MNATLSPRPSATLVCAPLPTSDAAAIVRLRCRALDTRDASPAGSPRYAYAVCLLTVCDVLDVARLNNHKALIPELWRSARKIADRIDACPKLS